MRLGRLPVPVVISGGEGNDRITGTAFADILIGGPGNDRFDGAAGDDILVGGDGNDRLNGGPGRDLVIGSAGADQLTGGGDDDILIAGSTIYDADTAANRAALADLRTAFADTTDYATRVASITAPTGVGASAARLIAETLDDDDAIDILNGGAGADLLFGNEGPEGVFDRLHARRRGELTLGL